MIPCISRRDAPGGEDRPAGPLAALGLQLHTTSTASAHTMTERDLIGFEA
jgi:hypothetical protein